MSDKTSIAKLSEAELDTVNGGNTYYAVGFLTGALIAAALGAEPVAIVLYGAGIGALAS